MPTLLYRVLIVFLIFAVLGSVPRWPYSTGWGYYPSGLFSLVLTILVLLWLLGKL